VTKTARYLPVKPARALLPSFALLLSVAVLPVTAVADSIKSGRELIGRMSVAMQELSYTGTFIYAHEGDVETMRIEHSKADGVERERFFLSLMQSNLHNWENSTDLIALVWIA